MKTAQAVIGLWWGDEGKGRVVDYLSHYYGGVVVRLNGGAQAGHTVVNGNTRHVFHHFGSGTLAKLPTHLSRFFICNPMVYKKEREELIIKGFTPALSCDKKAILTTPWDVAINQELEKNRGNLRHGSVGMGIYETTLRNEINSFQVNDLFCDYREKLKWIRDFYFPERASQLNIDLSDHPILSPHIINNYMQDCEYFISTLHDNYIEKSNHVIFEGAQGLLLDEEYNFDPIHSTPSNCGIKNVITIANEYNIESVNCIYVSRSYLTRHGAGYLPGECNLNINGQDKTNVFNEYQGKLRYANLDISKEKGSLDFSNYSRKKDKLNYAITCTDQFKGNWLKLNPCLIFNGEDRNDVIYDEFILKNTG